MNVDGCAVLPNGFLIYAINMYYARQGPTVADLAKFSSLLLLPWMLEGDSRRYEYAIVLSAVETVDLGIDMVVN